MKNRNLSNAKKEKNDEFYTQLIDIEKELVNYWPYFEDKVVYLNCDNEDSNFLKYFIDNFDKLKLKKVIAVGFNKDGKSYKIEVLPDADYN